MHLFIDALDRVQFPQDARVPLVQVEPLGGQTVYAGEILVTQ